MSPDRKTQLEEDIKGVLRDHSVYVKDSSGLVRDLVEICTSRKDLEPEKAIDDVLRDIEEHTPLEYWRKECPELFEYPDNMYGYKTAWDFLVGIYDSQKHRTLYYKDLGEINIKLYNAVYRKNKEYGLLPNEDERIKREVEKFCSKGIDLSDLSKKAREKWRRRLKKYKKG